MSWRISTESLENKRIWIIGASSGIGEALAYELGRRGAVLALSARRLELLHKVERSIREAGGRAHVFPADVTRRQDLRETAQKIEKELGPLDILIANAGSHIETTPLRFNSEEYLSLMQLNYGGMLHSIEAVLPEMIARKSGHIVAVASLSGYRGLPTAGAYGASKSAMIHFLESFRFHVEEVGLSVSIVNPGFVRTPLTDKNDFPMPFLMEPEPAARIVCNGIEKRKKEISFPFPFNYLLKCARVLPYPLYSILVKMLWSRMPRK